MKRGNYLRTKEILKKMSESHKGKIPYNKGIKISDEMKKKISIATKEAMTSSVCLKISQSRKGKKCSDSHRKAISDGNKGKTSGEKHYKWKGGTRRAGDKIYTSTEYSDWRMKVFVRDDFTCVLCKVKGKRLQADHILPKCEYPELIFSLNNGRTLCEDCHKKTDTYGVNKKFMINKINKKLS